MRKNALWKGKRLSKYPFLGIENLLEFCKTYEIPVDEITVYDCL